MRHLSAASLTTLFLAVFLGAAPAAAQELPGEEPKDKPAAEPAEAIDTKVDLKILGFQLKPQTKSELEAAMALWFTAYRAKVKEISALEIREAKGEDLTEPRLDAETEKGAIETRLKLVLKELEAKGGDPAEPRKYIDSLSGFGLEDAESLLDSKEALKLTNDLYVWALRPDGGIKFAARILSILFVLLFFRLLAWFISRGVAKAVTRSRNMTAMLREFLVGMTRKLVKFIGLVVALSMIGIEVGPFVAGIGAIGFIVAFALQGTLSNFAAGVMILMYRPYDIGNYVSVSGASGSVEAMSLVSTTLLTPDNQMVVVPNSSIWGGIITNVTGKDTRRVDLVFGIGYDDDIARAQEILEEVVAANPKVLSEPATSIRVSELADSSVNFVVRPWCKTSDYWDVRFDLTRAVKERFDEAGVSIPFPQTDIHVHGLEAPSAPKFAPPPAAASVPPPATPPSAPRPLPRPLPRPPRPPSSRLS